MYVFVVVWKGLSAVGMLKANNCLNYSSSTVREIEKKNNVEFLICVIQILLAMMLCVNVINPYFSRSSQMQSWF